MATTASSAKVGFFFKILQTTSYHIPNTYKCTTATFARWLSIERPAFQVLLDNFNVMTGQFQAEFVATETCKTKAVFSW